MSPFNPHPAIAFEFDGTVNSFESGWQGATALPDEPVDGAFALIKGLVDSGVLVYIVSERFGMENGVFTVNCWLVQHGLSLFTVNSLRFVTKKPAGVGIVDRLAYGYPGALPKLLDLRPDDITWNPPHVLSSALGVAASLRVAAEFLQGSAEEMAG